MEDKACEERWQDYCFMIDTCMGSGREQGTKIGLDE